MSRLNPIPPTEMSAPQKALFEEITGGARGAKSDRSEFLNEEGALRGPFNAMLRVPELGSLVQRVGEKVRFGTSLPEGLRELAILVCARHWRSNYEWFAHARIARRVGVSEQSINDVMEQCTPSPIEEATVYRFVNKLNTIGRVPTPDYEAAMDLLGEEGVTELAILSGYYALIAQLLNTFEVPLPVGETVPFPD